MLELKNQLEVYLGAYYSEAPTNATYPYSVFDITINSKDDNKYSCTLEINVWDKNQYYSRAEELADRTSKLLDGTIKLSDEVLFYCFEGSRDHVLDEDKQIKRIRMQFELYFYERS